MYQRKLFLLSAVFLCVVLFSCKSSHKRVPRTNIGNWKLVKGDLLNIPIDSTVSNTAQTAIDYHKIGDSSFITVGDGNGNNLLVFNLSAKQLRKKIHFQKDGPNGIGKFHVADFIGYDSILVRGDHKHKFYLMDSTGTIKHTYEVKLPGSDEGRPTLATTGCRPMLLNGKIIGLLNPNVNQAEHKYVLTDLPFFVYSGQSAKMLRSVSFPELLKDDHSWPMFEWEPAVCKYKGAIVYTFPVSDSIYVLDVNSEKVKAYGVPDVEGYLLPSPPSEVAVTTWGRAAKSDYLNYLLRYDPFKNVFYRFILHPLEKDANYLDFYSTLVDRPMTIQIIDGDDFTVKGETKLAAKTFFFLDSFVTPDGLYISNNNQANPENQEDFISYTQFKISK